MFFRNHETLYHTEVTSLVEVAPYTIGWAFPCERKYIYTIGWSFSCERKCMYTIGWAFSCERKYTYTIGWAFPCERKYMYRVQPRVYRAPL